MMWTILAWFLPHDIWSWLGYILAAVLIVLLWLAPAVILTLTERIAGTLVILAGICLIAQWGALSRAEAQVGKLKIDVRTANAAAAAAEQKNRLLEQAAIERAMDDTQIANMHKDLTDAINAARDGDPGPASLALACERLRRAGKTTSAEYHSLCP